MERRSVARTQLMYAIMNTWIHPVWIDSPWESLQKWISQHSFDGAFILMDENSHQFCLNHIQDKRLDFDFHSIIIAPGEEHKNLETSNYIWSSLNELGANRHSLLITLGGGVISDIGGFCASTYHRGIDVLHIPTTLLSMADAALGGKTGIDLYGLKNQVGSTHMPAAVLIDPFFLNTLPDGELHSGFAEICKHALLADPLLWEQLQSMGNKPWENPDDWPTMLQRAIPVKMNVVTRDPLEKSIRKSLNYGHTVGHAFESYFLIHDKHIPHGWAVAAGMQIENHMAVRLGIMAEEVCIQINQVLSTWFPKLPLEGVDLAEIRSLMQRDKKNRKGTTAFSLISTAGQFVNTLQINDDQLINAALLSYLQSE